MLFRSEQPSASAIRLKPPGEGALAQLLWAGAMGMSDAAAAAAVVADARVPRRAWWQRRRLRLPLQERRLRAPAQRRWQEWAPIIQTKFASAATGATRIEHGICNDGWIGGSIRSRWMNSAEEERSASRSREGERALTARSLKADATVSAEIENYLQHRGESFWAHNQRRVSKMIS